LLLERNNDLTIAPLPDRPQHGGNLVWAASLAHCSPSAILDFSASINPLGPPESAIAAIQAHLGDLKAYPDPQYSALRSALGAFHQMPPEYILPGNGAAELLTWACRDLAALDGTYLFTPAFSDYQRALKAFNAHVLARPLAPQDDRHWNFEQALPLEAGKQRLSGQALGLLLNNPHNPTGSLLTKHRLQPHLYDYALVVVDEAFMDFLPPDEQQSVIDLVLEQPNLVVLRSLTKFYSLPGLRLGYAIAHPDRLKRWQEWRDPWSVNALAAAAGARHGARHCVSAANVGLAGSRKASVVSGFSYLAGITAVSGCRELFAGQVRAIGRATANGTSDATPDPDSGLFEFSITGRSLFPCRHSH
jgi:histidinol-phosphate/aromatic aminotransferase/cobyric acid decarboxylase-like protein